MTRTKSIFAAIVFLVVLATSFSYFFYKSFRAQWGGLAQNRSALTELLKDNEDYKAARQLLGSGDYVRAESYYRKVLSGITDPVQQAQVQLDIAQVIELQGRYAEAISLLKQVIARTDLRPNQHSPDITPVRAYAVQEMGMMYYRHADSKDLIAEETFRDAPYNSLSVDGADRELAYRKLFEYGCSIRPLALMESMVASWYAYKLRYDITVGTTSSVGVTYIANVRTSIEKADADVERTKDSPVPASLFPEIFMREGIALSNMAAAGVGSASDAEERFKKSIASMSPQHNKAGNFGAYYYAMFLASTYGKSRAEDITSLLAVFRRGNEENIYAEVPKYLMAIRTRDDLRVPRAGAVLLGTLDPDFKTYLMSIGWSEANFNAAKE